MEFCAGNDRVLCDERINLEKILDNRRRESSPLIHPLHGLFNGGRIIAANHLAIYHQQGHTFALQPVILRTTFAGFLDVIFKVGNITFLEILARPRAVTTPVSSVKDDLLIRRIPDVLLYPGVSCELAPPEHTRHNNEYTDQ